MTLEDLWAQSFGIGLVAMKVSTRQYEAMKRAFYAGAFSALHMLEADITKLIGQGVPSENAAVDVLDRIMDEIQEEMRGAVRSKEDGIHAQASQDQKLPSTSRIFD